MPSKNRLAQRATVTISLGYAEMQTYGSLAAALRDLASDIERKHDESEPPRTNDRRIAVFDANGNTVGQLTTSHHNYDTDKI
jgi:hypothetical protein